MLQKWVAAKGKGHELECCLRMKMQRETEEKDGGKYVNFTAVLAHFDNDSAKALEFCDRRRKEAKGVKRDLNDPSVEKYLLFHDSEYSITTRTLDANSAI